MRQNQQIPKLLKKIAIHYYSPRIIPNLSSPCITTNPPTHRAQKNHAPPNCESIPRSGFHTHYDHCRFRKVNICDNYGDTKESLFSLCWCEDGASCKENTFYKRVEAGEKHVRSSQNGKVETQEFPVLLSRATGEKEIKNMSMAIYRGCRE